jgi:peptide subunit release factor RF-3
MTDDFYDDFFRRVTAWLTSAIHVIDAATGVACNQAAFPAGKAGVQLRFNRG